MSDPGFASLGPSLLARKGGAKPAMRPQVAPLVESHADIAAEQLEDLGWNDMGDSDRDGGAEIVPINADIAPDGIPAHPGPIVRRQQRRLEERVLADAAMTGPEGREPEYDEDAEALYGEARDEEYGYDDKGEEADTALYAPLAPEPVAAKEGGHVEEVAPDAPAVGGGGQEADIAGQGPQVAAVVGQALQFQGDASNELGLGGGVDARQALDDVAVGGGMADG